MVKTGIYGGSFNPIHNGHIALAERILETSRLDEIWFVVSPQNPLKTVSADLLEDKKRLEMVQEALYGHPKMKACDYEFNLPRPSYTWHTLQAMSKDYPQHEFSLLIGADNWADFQNWFNYQEIINRYPIIIYPRRKSPIDRASLPENVTLADTEQYNISSTDIRNRIRNGMTIEGLVPKSIEKKAAEYYAR